MREISRAQFLRLTGAGLVGSALLSVYPDLAIAQTSPPGILLGAHVGWNRYYPNTKKGSTYLQRWTAWSSRKQQGKTPYMFCDWFNFRAPVDKIRNFDNNDVLSIYKQDIKAKSFFLTFNIRPASGQDMLDLYNGQLSPSGYTADEHVVMIGQRLAEFCVSTGEFVRLRYLHEMTGPSHPWCAFDPDGTAREFTTGHYRQLYRRWQLILAGGSVADIDSKLADITARTGDPAQPKLAETISAERLSTAGYPQFGTGTLPTNTNFATVWTGSSSKPTLEINNDENDYFNYYPGNEYVGYVGCDIFPGNEWATVNEKFANLDKVYALAQQQGKPFAIPEWSLDNSPERINDTYGDRLVRIAEWMIARPLDFAANFEVKQNDGDWRLANKSAAMTKWREYVTSLAPDRFLGDDTSGSVSAKTKDLSSVA
jgi:hypothetical protein